MPRTVILLRNFWIELNFGEIRKVASVERYLKERLVTFHLPKEMANYVQDCACQPEEETGIRRRRRHLQN